MSPWFISESLTHILKLLYGARMKLLMLLSGSFRFWWHFVCCPRCSLRKKPLRIKGDIRVDDTVLVSEPCSVYSLEISMKYVFPIKLFGMVQRCPKIN